MILYLHTILFPDGEEYQCREAVAQCNQQHDYLGIRPENYHWRRHNKGIVTLSTDYCCAYGTLAEKLSGLTDCPVMLLYIYHDDFWGYYLFHKGMELDRFVSWPDYFHPGYPPNKPGNAQIVSQYFGVAPDSLENYLTPWDKHDMGDCWQMTEFMGTLGFDYDELYPTEEIYYDDDVEETDDAEGSSPKPWHNYDLPVHTPILPNAVTDRNYILGRAEEVLDVAEDAVRLFQDMQYRDAVPLLTEAVRNHPDRAALYLLRAFCWNVLEFQGERARKIDMEQDLTKALEIEPDNIMVLRALYSETFYTRRRSRIQIPYLTHLMELDPENQDIYQAARAYLHHWAGDNNATSADLKVLLERNRLWTDNLIYLCQNFMMPEYIWMVYKRINRPISVSLYYEAGRTQPVTPSEQSICDKIAKRYNTKYPYKKIAKRYNTKYSYRELLCDGFCIHIPEPFRDESGDDVILTGSAKLPMVDNLALFIRVINWWLKCLGEITDCLSDAQWHVHINDVDLPWERNVHYLFPVKDDENNDL